MEPPPRRPNLPLLIARGETVRQCLPGGRSQSVFAFCAVEARAVFQCGLAGRAAPCYRPCLPWTPAADILGFSASGRHPCAQDPHRLGWSRRGPCHVPLVYLPGCFLCASAIWPRRAVASAIVKHTPINQTASTEASRPAVTETRAQSVTSPTALWPRLTARRVAVFWLYNAATRVVLPL